MDDLDSLIVFLRARYDEDTEVAQRGYYSDTHWERFSTEAHLTAWQAWRSLYPREQWDPNASNVIANAARDGVRERITAHEADRTVRALADIEAKRKRLERLAAAIRQGYDDYDIATELLLFDALPYADHPAYTPEWAPTAASEITTA